MPAANSTARARPQLVAAATPSAEWVDDYPRLEPGAYKGYCRFAKWYRDPQFKRWTCLLLFDTFAEGNDGLLGTIPLWFNGGNGPKPRASRRGQYLPAWVKANGGSPPRKDRLSPEMFTKRMARIRVADTKKGHFHIQLFEKLSDGKPAEKWVM